MSTTICRLMLSLAAIAGACVLYVVAFFITIEWFWGWGRDEAALWVADVTSCGFLVVAWIAIWMREVRITRARILSTITVLIGSGVVAVTVALPLAWTAGANDIGILVGGMTFAVTWLAGSAIVWRETAAERSDRLLRMGIRTIACPSCGYNLTGLREAACPECGTRYTLDQLYASLLEHRTPVEV